MKKKVSFIFILQTAAALGAVTAVLLPVFLADFPWPVKARDYLERFGVAESGAINLVSAIYLGYRAFDTLGETIVLLVAVSGTIGIIAKAGAGPAIEIEKTHALRTNLIETVTGKLGPIVLLFGFYVMLFGHLSPGGGFQGGVVIASGIVFLALGKREGSAVKLNQTSVLAGMESGAFLLLTIVSISGLFLGGGFFTNPLSRFSLPPSGFIILLNAVIGLKVGAGIGLMCIVMMEKEKT